MTRWSALAALLLAGAPVAAQPPRDSTRAVRPVLPPDRWLGADKAKHFFMAGFTAAAGFSAARLAGLDRRPALGMAAGLAATTSMGKEVRDRRVTGRFSARDLVADALGAAAYAALLARTAR